MPRKNEVAAVWFVRWEFVFHRGGAEKTGGVLNKAMLKTQDVGVMSEETSPVARRP
jgi:hypothetical protein